MPKTQHLPGMPGPAEDSLERQDAVRKVLELLHDALLPALESLPSEVHSVIKIRRKIKGDIVVVTFTPGTEE